MNSIWLTGPSGTGKSTFAKDISESFGIPIKKEVTRANEHILKQDFATRQLYFALTYVNRHRASENERFISDRTILDYIFWTAYHGGKMDFLMHQFMEVIVSWFVPGDIVVAIDVPNDYDLFKEQIFQNFMTDPMRYAIYINKHNDICGYSPYTEEEFCEFLFSMSQAMFHAINRMLDRHQGEMGIHLITPEPINEDNFWSWQVMAKHSLEKIINGK